MFSISDFSLNHQTHRKIPLLFSRAVKGTRRIQYILYNEVVLQYDSMEIVTSYHNYAGTKAWVGACTRDSRGAFPAAHGQRLLPYSSCHAARDRGPRFRISVAPTVFPRPHLILRSSPLSGIKRQLKG